MVCALGLNAVVRLCDDFSGRLNKLVIFDSHSHYPRLGYFVSNDLFLAMFPFEPKLCIEQDAVQVEIHS